MKLINIISIALSVILIGISFYYVDEVYFLKWRNNFAYDGYNAANYNSEGLTVQVGLLTGLFFGYFAFGYIKNLRLNLRKQTKTLAIIGSVLTVGILFWDGIMISSPSHISFDEVGMAWMGYALVNGVIYYLMYKQIGKPINIKPSINDSILDELEELDDLEL